MPSRDDLVGQLAERQMDMMMAVIAELLPEQRKAFAQKPPRLIARPWVSTTRLRGGARRP